MYKGCIHDVVGLFGAYSFFLKLFTIDPQILQSLSTPQTHINVLCHKRSMKENYIYTHTSSNKL